jgi:hypothetical protein
MLNCSDWWCQGYSEPGAGSDLAGLKTTAPGTVVEVDQRSDPLLLDRASTLAAQL